jgi:D-arginine dehydrogenase
LSAPLIVNAAGAWADLLASQAGLAPLRLTPLRRTAILIDGPDGTETRSWPFTKTVIDDFYMLPEGGKLIASPVDEIAAEPCDAQPEELDVAVAAAKVEEYTTLTVRRIAHSWAGLRTFAPDRTPVVGPDPREPSFFWLAGQGGFGLQTAPAMAAAAASLLLDRQWPQALAAEGVHAHGLSPERLIHGS